VKKYLEVIVKRLILTVVLGLALITLFCPSGRADEFVRGVYPATPPSAFTLYAFDRDLLGAWNTPLFAYEKKYIPEKYQNLPILGGWYGQGFVPDREALMGSGLKKAFMVANSYFNIERIRDALKEMGLTLQTAPDGVENLPETFRTMGQVFNRPERGEELAVYAEKALTSLKNHTDKLTGARPRVYFAMSADGLATSCPGEQRSNFIVIAGGQNAMICDDSIKAGRPRISFEQLITMDPDVILAESYALKKEMDSGGRWGKLRAAKEGRVYLLPRGPFSWNGHPTLTTLMGARFLANALNPRLYPLAIVPEAQEFNRLFFRVEMTEQMVKELLDPRLASDE
jgi:iron complex transport system substrate-binding protein